MKSEGGNQAQILVRLFRELTEEQFDYWIDCLNSATAAMKGKGAAFTRDDRQKTISYWYLLMFLLEVYAKNSDPFAAGKEENWVTSGLLTMKTLTQEFEHRYKEQTIRRYMF